MGVTASTPANLVIGAGDVYVDTAPLGATKDANTFAIEQEYFVPELNGVPGELEGTHYKTKENATLAVSLPEISAASLALMWPGSAADTVGDATTIDTDGTRRIPTSAYHDWELRIPGLNGKEFSFQADNALQVDNVSIEGQNKDMVAPKITVHSTWSAAALTTSPHRIVITVPAS